MGKVIWYVCKYVTPLKYGWASRQFYLAREFQAMGHRAVVVSSDSNHLGRFPEFRSTYTREEIEGDRDLVDPDGEVRTHRLGQADSELARLRGQALGSCPTTGCQGRTWSSSRRSRCSPS